jgi:hypothetical protein
MKKLIATAVLFTGFLFAQTGWVPGMRLGTLAQLPATCRVGEQYFATNAVPGFNKYSCTSTNVWTRDNLFDFLTNAFFPWGTPQSFAVAVPSAISTHIVWEFPLNHYHTLTRIVWENTVASGDCGDVCGARWGIYNAAGTTLLAQTGPLLSGGTPDINTTGYLSANLTAPITLPPGRYKLALITDVANVMEITMYGLEGVDAPAGGTSGWWNQGVEAVGNAANGPVDSGADIAFPTTTGALSGTVGAAPVVLFR